MATTPVDCGEISEPEVKGDRSGPSLLHASVELTLLGMKDCVAAGGMTCETVVDAATELALEVTMVCAYEATVKTEAARKILDNMFGMGLRE